MKSVPARRLRLREGRPSQGRPEAKQSFEYLSLGLGRRKRRLGDFRQISISLCHSLLAPGAYSNTHTLSLSWLYRLYSAVTIVGLVFDLQTLVLCRPTLLYRFLLYYSVLLWSHAGPAGVYSSK
ncbi:hypothetical protein N8I77_003370 [Diaporthe amygdali]|uniref:Uncharacterized protein n=1 Tax=Phomopsis amygdali TaxID=1214568 RepID=A0AAD9SIP8_PHOAM|nr:hypothetical protein N8I77_003370 [Diaporthe amygdali]